MDMLIHELEQMCNRDCAQNAGKLIMRMEPVILDKTNGALDGRFVWEYLCSTGNLTKVDRYNDVTPVGRHNGFIRLFRYKSEGKRYPIVVCTPQAQRYLINCVCKLLVAYEPEKG